MIPGSAPRRPWALLPESGTAHLQRLRKFALLDTNVVVLSVILTNVLRAVSSMILTRLLVPEVFGIAGIIASIHFTVSLASDLGFQAFVVRHNDGDEPRFLNTVWTVSVIRSALLALVLITLASPIAQVFGKPELAPLVAVSGLIFILEGVASLSLLTALRRRLILKLSILELIVLVFQITVSTVLAFLWGSYWAILGALLASGGLKSLLSYTMFEGSLQKPAWDRNYLRDLWSFARFVTGSSIIFLMISQVDKLVLARVMPLEQFGFYMLGTNLASAPFAFASAYASRVLYPTYAQLWREGRTDLRERFYAKRMLPSVLYSFASGGIIGAAPLIIAILYDERYAAAAVYLQVLGIASLLALASNAANEALTATGRINATLQASIIKLVWLAGAGTVGYLELGSFGLVIAVGLIEVPALLLKWVRMHRAGLLDLSREMLFLMPGVIGMCCGYGGSNLAKPLF